MVILPVELPTGVTVVVVVAVAVVVVVVVVVVAAVSTWGRSVYGNEVSVWG
jgi:hypothetical protein